MQDSSFPDRSFVLSKAMGSKSNLVKKSAVDGFALWALLIAIGAGALAAHPNRWHFGTAAIGLLISPRRFLLLAGALMFLSLRGIIGLFMGGGTSAVLLILISLFACLPLIFIHKIFRRKADEDYEKALENGNEMTLLGHVVGAAIAALAFFIVKTFS